MLFRSDAGVMLPEHPRVLAPAAWLATRTLRAGTIATMPRWMRRMGGLHQSRIVDAAVRPVLWTAFRLVDSHPEVKLAVLGYLSPSTRPIVEPVFRGVPAVVPEVVSPAEARARHGYDEPSRAHPELRARQAARVFGEGVAPSEEGLVESESILGAMA